MARKFSLSLRALIVGTLLGFAFSASALPMSSKYMRSPVAKKSEPSGELDINPNPGGGGGGPVALPLPGSAWLVLAGLAGLVIQRRKKSAK